jgi:hypothetical protein
VARRSFAGSFRVAADGLLLAALPG